MKSRTTRRFDTGDVALAANILSAGGLVAFPTETVYGLGGNAFDVSALEDIFLAKDRPRWDPLIVHVADRQMLSTVAAVPHAAERLIEAFWPGPLTLLLPRTRALPDLVTAGRDLVGVRMPAHDLALQLIGLAGVPVAAPSANRFGRTSPTKAAHVLADLDGRIDAVLDGGSTRVGVESTVFDVAQNLLYRPGAITQDMLSQCLGRTVRVFQPTGAEGELEDRSSPNSASPGISLRHYAPRARLVLVEGAPDTILERMVLQTVDRLGDGVGLMLPEGWSPGRAAHVFPWGRWNDMDALARRLFLGMRALDELGAAAIVCPVPAVEGIGAAVRDRLKRAAGSV